MAELKHYAWLVSALCSVLMAPLAVWYSYPDFVSTCIAAILDAAAGFRSRLTPPVLFLLMNGVVLSLAFTSGFLKQRQDWRGEEELEDLSVRRKKHYAEEAEEEEEEERVKDDEEDDAFYPEVLGSFFGEGVTRARRKPVLRRSASEPLAERRGRSFYPSIRGSLSQKLSNSPSLLASPNPAETVSSPQPPLKVLRPAPTTAPKTPAFELKKPLSVFQGPNANGEDKDVDQRADAFIGGFYKNLKLQQVDPYAERLERSY